VSATAPDLDRRYVRVCKLHGLELRPGAGDTVVCPRGGRHGHRVDDWNTVDRSKGVVLASASREGSGVQDLNRKVLPPAPPPPKKETHDRRKFIDGSGLSLFLSLRCEPGKFGGDPYRIRWRIDEGKKAGKVQGISSTSATLEDARLRFMDAVANAEGQGWKRVELSAGGGRRALTLRPIPAPRKKAS
jgi:hypothetical protein